VAKQSSQKGGRMKKKKKQSSVKCPVGIAAKDRRNKAALFPIGTVSFVDIVWEGGNDTEGF
jgi:hypothetical protein